MSAPTPAAPGYSARLGVGVALLSLALLMTEIVLTRIFSVVIWYHFAFLAISVALFGTAVAAIAVHVLQTRLSTSATAMPTAAAAFAVSTAVADVVLVRVVPRWIGQVTPEVHLTTGLLVTFAVTAAPFFCAGAAISLALLRAADGVHRLYFWDLIGAGVGCLAVIALLESFGGPVALLACGAGGAVSSLVLGAAGERGSPRARYLPGVLSLLVVGGLLVAHLGGDYLAIRHAKGHDLRARPLEFNRWNSHSMVSVMPEPHFQGWGMSPTHDGPVPERKSVIIDMNALTVMTRFDGDLGAVRYLLSDLSAFVYRVVEPPGRVCVLGAGGGRDALTALTAGAEQVTAVEINPIIVRDVVQGAYADFSGDIYRRPDVEVAVADGRSYLRGSDESYDVLLVSMVDTSAATAAGAYALTENNLYTVEAFDEFFDHLAPGGVLSVSSVTLPGLAVGARLVALAGEVLRGRGLDPAAAVAVVETPWLGLPGAMMRNVLVKPDGFSAEELQRLHGSAEALRFGIGYAPGREPIDDIYQQAFAAMLRIPEAALPAYYAGLPLDVSPVHDDRPFFFYQDRLAHFWEALLSASPAHPFGNGLVFLAKLLAISVVMVLLCVLAPLRLARRVGQPPSRRALVLSALFGLGFMLVEIALIQRLTGFLGNPTHTLAAVLCVLLLAGGTGSRLSGRLPDPARNLGLVMFGVAGTGLLLAFGLPPVLDAAQGAPAAVRALIAAACMLVPGLLLGMPLPGLLRRAAAGDPRRLPWLWGVNGATSVLGSVVATFVSLHAGITATLLSGVVAYALAGALWLGYREG